MSIWYQLTKDTESDSAVAIGAGSFAIIPLLLFGTSITRVMSNMLQSISLSLPDFSLYLLVRNSGRFPGEGLNVLIKHSPTDMIVYLSTTIIISIICGILLAKLYKKNVIRILIRPELYIVPILYVFGLIFGMVLHSVL